MSPELIVALDVDTLEKAKNLVDCLYPKVKFFKIGSQLFTAYGPEVVKIVAEKGSRIFLDLKFYDIPQTAYGASSSASNICIKPVSGIEEPFKAAVFMITVHTQGGKKMLEEAVRGATDRAMQSKIERPRIIGVTVLTSDKQEDTAKDVLERSKLAQEAGLDGVVCSVAEAALVRKTCGKNFIIVTPGIRPQGSEKKDQQRIATPAEAKKAGADYIVVGRPILDAEDPLKAAEDILKELE